MTTEITVLTFNLWGIFNSKHRAARMAHFASKVERYDVILLQELFSETDFELILRSLPPRVRASRFFRRFPSAYYGSGIAVISRFPIKSVLFHAFPLQGYPERVLHGDYYANKGAALVRISVPCMEPTEADGGQSGETGVVCKDVLLYSTHLVAAYEKTARLLNWRDELYLSVRLSQALSFADFITSTSCPTDHVVIGGDFNATQRSLEVQTMLILLQKRGYKLRSVLPSSNIYQACDDERKRAANAATLTFSDANIFTSPKAGWLVEGGDVPCQIDHIFFSSNTLRLCAYDDCPDAAQDYPFVMENDGVESPAGVVVFTRNDEVSLPPGRSTMARVADWLRAKGEAMNCRTMVTAACWLTPEARPRAYTAEFCPLSDHYGVVARLRLSAPAAGTTASEGDDTAGEVTLARADEEVLHEALEFLDASVKQLQYERTVCVRMATVSAVLVAGNILFLWYQAWRQEQHTARVLEQLFTVATLEGTSTRTAAPPANEVKNVVMHWARKAKFWSPGAAPQAAASPATPAAGAPMNAPGAVPVNFAEVAAKIHDGGIWPMITHFFTICGSLLSVGSLAIGLLQRDGNAKIMAEQVSELRQVCSR
ncbi:putative eukaryotic translation initiation factor 3 subunit [Trypanosoma grayi]|uniref:putative eukaryotic translation initiation factor 3 subunit n=1 Tax=Trypanosoma grayi TaxID=71804 RepID=UPI0004F48DFA|nr:putative eukaryotic translation initiation factor 3 subunit [Trypanosoma grayi]KEG08089.1 putative eukaryotic translation initiation factor 3 subunit [Trypanosoma grayi]